MKYIGERRVEREGSLEVAGTDEDVGEHEDLCAGETRRLTLEVPGCRSTKRGGNLQAWLAGGPIDRWFGRLCGETMCHQIQDGCGPS